MAIDLGGMGKKILPKTLGKIAIGRKNAQGWPEKLDHFIFTEPVDPKTKAAAINKEVTEAMEAKFGVKPKTIMAYLPFHHLDEVFYTNFASYPGTTWDCKSEDGVTATRKLPGGETKVVPCNWETCQWRQRLNAKKQPFNTCKPTGLLSLDLPDAPNAGGVWRFTTHSYLSISEILYTLQGMSRGGRSLYGLEVLLNVRIVSKDIPDGKGGITKQNVPIVSITVPKEQKTLAERLGSGYVGGQDTLASIPTVNTLPNPQILKELSASLDDEEVIDGVIVEGEEGIPSTDEIPPNSFVDNGAPKSDEDLF